MLRSDLINMITMLRFIIFSVTNRADATAERSGITNVSLVVVGLSAVNGFGSLPYEGPAISLAVEHIHKIYEGIMQFKLYYISNASCDGLRDNLVSEVSKWHYQKRNPDDISVYIDTAPACAGQNELSYLQKQWDTLVISTLAANPQTHDELRYPTWLFTSHFHLLGMSEFYLDVLQEYKWTSLFIIIDTLSPPFFDALASAFINGLSSQGTFTPVVRRIAAKPGMPFGKFRPILEDAEKVSRIVLYFGYGVPLREFLVTAFFMNMTNDEYVYILAENGLLRPMRWQHNDPDDQAALQAFQSVILLDLDEDTNTSSRSMLGEEFHKRSARDYNFTYNLADQPYILIAANYISVIALAQVINETLSSCEDADCGRGSSLARNFMNRTFKVDSDGDSMYIDSVGVRRTNCMVSFFDHNGNRQPFLRKTDKNGALMRLGSLTSWGGASFPPPNEPQCGYQRQRASCLPRNNDRSNFVIIFASAGACCIIAAFSFVCLKRRSNQDFLLNDKSWQIDLLESTIQRSYQIRPLRNKDHLAERRAETLDDAVHFAEYNGTRVMCSKLCSRNQRVTFHEMSLSRALLLLLHKLKRMDHLNICEFYGISVNKSTGDTWWISAVAEYPSRDVLPHIFDSVITTDAALTTSFTADYLDALEYIHSSTIQYHGRLSILSCRIDKHFTLKVANLGYNELRRELCVTWKNIEDCDSYPSWEKVYQTVPEKLLNADVKAIQAVDVWSSGLIIFDILTRGALCARLRAARQGDAEFSPSYVTHQHLYQLVGSSQETRFMKAVVPCLNFEPALRPTVQQIRKMFNEEAGPEGLGIGHSTLVERIYKRITDYSVDLEHQVAERKVALRREIRKCDDLINEFLPRAIVKLLRAGSNVMPEFFDCVTIMFTDLYGFGDFVRLSQPEDVISLVGQIEAGIDELSEECDVYKVEAVGDTYLVASGLPVRIGNAHVQQVANFALKITDAEARLISIQATLRFRVGIHSGACATGLMGTKRPRYCLFGDTVNMASRMCSHGLPGRIHLSPESQFLLEQFPQYIVRPRGWLAIKGKCVMKTYWLAGLRR